MRVERLDSEEVEMRQTGLILHGLYSIGRIDSLSVSLSTDLSDSHKLLGSFLTILLQLMNVYRVNK